MAPLCHFPSETSRDCATWCWGCGSARDWRWREGSSGNLLLDSPPFPSPQRTNSSVPHRHTDRRSVSPRQQHHHHRENKLSLAAALEATDCRGADRQGAERPGAMGNAKCYRVLWADSEQLRFDWAPTRRRKWANCDSGSELARSRICRNRTWSTSVGN